MFFFFFKVGNITTLLSELYPTPFFCLLLDKMGLPFSILFENCQRTIHDNGLDDDNDYRLIIIIPNDNKVNNMTVMMLLMIIIFILSVFYYILSSVLFYIYLFTGVIQNKNQKNKREKKNLYIHIIYSLVDV